MAPLTQPDSRTLMCCKTRMPQSHTYQLGSQHLDLAILDLLQEFKNLFSDVPYRRIQTYYNLDVGNVVPVQQHPCFQHLSENDFIESSNSNRNVLVPKPDGSFGMCIDQRKVNCVTKTDTSPIPRVDDCIDKSGKKKTDTFPKCDLLDRDFLQVSLSNHAQEVSAFTTPDDLYQK